MAVSALIEPLVTKPTGRGIHTLVATNLIAARVIAPISVGLLAVLFLLTLAGAVARYLLASPLLWVDEVLTTLLVCFVMLGAALATARDNHMRIAGILTRLSSRGRDRCSAVALLLSIIFQVALVPAAVGHAASEWIVTTPILGLPNGLPGIAIAGGMALGAMFSVMRLVDTVSLGDFVFSLIAVAVVAAIAWLAAPLFADHGNVALLVFLAGSVAACALIGVPIAFSFGLGALTYLYFATPLPVGIIAGRVEEGTAHLVLLAVPLFLILGVAMELSGLAESLICFLARLLRRVRGGLSYVVIASMFVVSGISGSKAADMAAVAPALLPELKRQGGSEHELVALLAATGAQTETVPPSFVLIVLGSVTSLSIGALFTAGILPALLAGLVLGLVCAWRSRHQPLPELLAGHDTRTLFVIFLLAIPALILPVFVRSLVIEGVVTATEVATFGVIYCVAIGLIFNRGRSWSELYEKLVETASFAGAILLILGTATAVAWTLAQSGLSRDVAANLVSLPGGRAGFLAISILLFIVLGSLLEGLPAIVLFGPMMFPIAAALGIPGVQYAMVVVLSMGLGLFAPPFGIGFYAACAIGRVEPERVMPLIWPYLAALLLVIVAIAAVPWLSLAFLEQGA